VTSRQVSPSRVHRLTDPVGIVVEVAERRALRAEVTLRQHVVAVAADQLDAVILDVDLQAAHALAQRTRHENVVASVKYFTTPSMRPDPGGGRRAAGGGRQKGSDLLQE
jgi:hypothetical protein